jgi:hypothetical protein
MIRESVGKGGRNGTGDVLYIQILLSDWLTRKGITPITIDGICGTHTIQAIQSFQRAEVGLTDGRVDPNGPTLRALQRKHIQALTSGKLMKPIPRAYLPIKRITSQSVEKLVDTYLAKLRSGLS